MKTSPDPLTHRQREQQLMQHVEKLLSDDRLRIDTVLGSRPVTTLVRDVSKSDRGVELKRLMTELNLPDRELQSRMPLGESIEVLLSQVKWWVLKRPVGRLRVVCTSPTRELLTGGEVKPISAQELSRLLSSMPPSIGGVPSTVVVVSTSGFTLDAHELADRRSDRTVILAEPNDAGGWSVVGPTPTKALADLFDPEAEQEKRARVMAHIDKSRLELTGSGVAADRIAASTQLPQQLVEAELKNYARANPGLVAKRLDGRVVLFREGATAASAASAVPTGGFTMPLLDRMRALFSRKGDNDKKIAFLAERRTALSQQRDRSYEEMGSLEQQEEALRRQFKEASGSITKRRVTSQLLQLRKDLERRQQLLAVLNQQINVVSTHLHNLELVQQGQTAHLPDSEEMTADAVKAEEMLAELEASGEIAGSVGNVATSGMSDEEQALYEELERESSGGAVTQPAAEGDALKPEAGKSITPPSPTARHTGRPEPAKPAGEPKRRGEAEPG